MKAFAKKLSKKFKRPKHTLVSNTGLPVTSSLADSMPSASADSATVSAQVIQAADVQTVSVQLSLSHQLYWHNFSIIVVDQTAQLGTSALVDDIASVAHVEEHRSTLPFSYDDVPYNPSVSCFQPCFSNVSWLLLMISRISILDWIVFRIPRMYLSPTALL